MNANSSLAAITNWKCAFQSSVRGLKSRISPPELGSGTVSAAAFDRLHRKQASARFQHVRAASRSRSNVLDVEFFAGELLGREAVLAAMPRSLGDPAVERVSWPIPGHDVALPRRGQPR